MEVLPGIHLVPGVRWSRVYLVEGDSLTLVDAGLPWSVGRVLGYIEAIGRNVEDLSSILMTHSHPDHASGALAISRRTGAEIFAHGDDTRTHSDRVITLSYMRVFTSLKVPLPFLQRTPVSHLVVSDQVLPLLGGTRVIHTPGHTAGSVCYLLESRGVIFTGDTAFSDGERVSRSVALPRTRRSQLQGIAGQAGGPPVRHPLWRPWGASRRRRFGHVETSARGQAKAANLEGVPGQHPQAPLRRAQTDRRGLLRGDAPACRPFLTPSSR